MKNYYRVMLGRKSAHAAPSPRSPIWLLSPKPWPLAPGPRPLRWLLSPKP